MTIKNSRLVFLILFAVNLLGCKVDQTNSTSNSVTNNNSFIPPVNTDRFRLFDSNWKFFKGELAGAEVPGYDDSQWRKLDLPHDWSIEDLPNQEAGKVVGPFHKSSTGIFYTGFTIGGTGWYRKSFVVDKSDLNKEFTIYFDGVYMESDVWLNGHHLGYHTHGYTPFYYELTEYINPPGEENTMAVRVKNIGDNSRWYSGSGIYRHVWLRETELLNIPVWGVFVTTPEVSAEKAKVAADISVENNDTSEIEFTVKSIILSPDGAEVSNSEKTERLEFKGKGKIEQLFEIKQPELWSVDAPSIYTLKTDIIADGKIMDSEETTFGIRSISFSPDNGFLLNGKSVLLKGACIHHDNGPLGSVAFDRADQRKIAILKANGFNAIRTSHNPPSQGFLDACDRQGMLVMDEAFDMWENPKRKDDYHQFFKEWHEKDLRSMILRDRNHPSVILWSIGNEIKERADSSGLRITKDLIQIIRNIDTTRAVTEGICEFWETPGRKWDDSAPAYALLDVCGYNYVFYNYEKDHARYPERVIAGTESFAMSIYENWQMAQEKPYVIGDFVWTGMDYIGESGIGQVMTDSVTMCWPWIISNCGDIDLIGNKKQQAYYRDVVWDRSPLEIEVEEIAPAGKKWIIRDWGWKRTFQSWNWPGNEGKNMKVYVYTKCDEVRLEMNGKEIAAQTATPDSKFTYTFNVHYNPGTLEAIAFSKGKKVATKSLITSGPPEKLKIIPDWTLITSNRNDLAYLMVELIDSNGNIIPDAVKNVSFHVDGEAEIAAVGNANPREPKSFQNKNCNTFQGRCLVILRPTGKAGNATLTANIGNEFSEKCSIEIK